MDGYHAGFPCTMFSTVWAEETAPIGNKLNVMKGRYLRAEPSTWRRQLQSVGKFTRYCRCLRWRIHLPVIACNISRPGNFRKWTRSFNNFRYYARFNTCRYENSLQVRWFAGTRRPVSAASMLSTSRPWVRRSRRPQRNTLKSCAGNNYAILAISQLKLKLMGKEEFLQSRMACLQDTIAQAKAGVVEKEGHIEQTHSTTTESSEEKTTYHVQYTTKEAHQSQANTGQGNLSVIFAKAGTFK